MNETGFWDDVKEANNLNSELSNLKKENKKILEIEKKINGNLEMLELLETEPNSEMTEEVSNDIASIEKELSELEITTLLNGKYDKNNCYLEIHPGAGGTESCDWASMLLRMYQMFCDKEGYSYEMVDEQSGEEAGIKNATMFIKGLNAYGYLKCEQGVHRLVRISPFDSGGRRHTSFASVSITPEYDDTITVEIKEEDLKIDVYRSSGAGGQSVNTTDSAVRITHLPSKTVVTCQNERSQLKNKEQAMHLLKNKLYQIELVKKENELNEIKGETKNIDFGSQIRSYVLEPYTMIKDHRSGHETSNADKVLDGNIIDFINSVLKM